MNTRWDIDIFARAWEFATKYHAGQTYGGRVEGELIPYINHVASVAPEIMWALSMTPDLEGNLAIQCALLHDTLEDTDATYAQICEEFGIEVAEGIQALSKNPALPTREMQMEDSLTRIKQKPKEIWMVKLADRIANLYHPPFYWQAARIEEYRRESLSILHALGDASQILASRLQTKILEYGRS